MVTRAGCLRKRSHKELLLYLKNVCIYFCHLCRRELIHCSVMLTEQFLSGFIDGVVRASLVKHNDCHSLNLPEILRVNIQMLVGVLSKGHGCWSNFVVQPPDLPSRMLTLSNERRGRIAIAKCVKPRKTTCSGLFPIPNFPSRIYIKQLTSTSFFLTFFFLLKNPKKTKVSLRDQRSNIFTMNSLN